MTKSFYPFGQIDPFLDLKIGLYSLKDRSEKLIFSSDIHSNLELLENLGNIILSDFKYLTHKIQSKLENVTLYNLSNCYIGENVILRNCVLNAEKGPIIIGDNVEIQDYAVIHGPCEIGLGSKIAPHTFLRQNTIIGENCFIAGEVKNTLFFSHSNKGHYGYLGDSIIGQFCNLGAGTTSSNLKNNFSYISQFSIEINDFKKLEVNKLGVFLGDFSMTAVNTVFESGTVVGLLCNIYGKEICPKYVEDFSWGFFNTYEKSKGLKTAHQLLLHKGIFADEINIKLAKLDSIYQDRFD